MSDLMSLGVSTPFPKKLAPELLECFENKYPGREYVVQFETDEFTSLCPKTSQPDFATINIKYVPGKLCIESKSLKLFLGSFRNEGMFMEQIVNLILEKLCEVADPGMMVVTGNFKSRGGITQTVKAARSKPGSLQI